MIQGFARFKDAIAALPRKPYLEKADPFTDQFHLFGDGKIESYYAPFDYVNRAAKVALVGVTPGWTQMERAFRTTSNCLCEELTDLEVLRQVKCAGSFAGPMRKLLTEMLDGIEHQHQLHVGSCVELFEAAFDLLHWRYRDQPSRTERTTWTGTRILPESNRRTPAFIGKRISQPGPAGPAHGVRDSGIAPFSC